MFFTDIQVMFFVSIQIMFFIVESVHGSVNLKSIPPWDLIPCGPAGRPARICGVGGSGVVGFGGEWDLARLRMRPFTIEGNVCP
jgi:hypothetical protein